MNITRLFEILRDTTIQLRKGEEIIERESEDKTIHVTEVFAMPHESEVTNLEKVDCHFIIVGVDKTKALDYKEELIGILADWPAEAYGTPVPKLQEGPSYIHAGGVVGDQGAALQLFALGEVLGLWQVVTPGKLGITGDSADSLAGSGFVMIDGCKI